MSVIERAGAGVHLFEKDAIGECMYIIMEGYVEIFNDTKVSKAVDDKLPDDIIRRLGPGEYFGELALVSEGSKRKFGARVSKDEPNGARLITVDKDGFTQIFKHHPQVKPGPDFPTSNVQPPSPEPSPPVPTLTRTSSNPLSFKALAEIEMRILRDDVSIETILSHPEACRAFVEHMKVTTALLAF